MKFLIDEDVPKKLLKMLVGQGHDCVRVDAGSSDRQAAQRAKIEGRVLITLDKDFTNISIFPPKEYNIVRIQIHPPYADSITKAFRNLLTTISPEEIRNLILLQEAGHIRVTE